jgi:outer membrane protein TolC
MKYFYLILISFITSAEASTPRELVDFVSERAPLIKMYLEEENASEANVRQSKILANPLLTFQGGELRSAGTKGQVTDITLAQPLPWPGKRETGIRNQVFLNKISKLNLIEAKLELGHRVYLLAYELASLIEMEQHNKERRDRFNLISKYLNSRPLVSPRQLLEKDLILTQLRIVEKSMNEATARRIGLEHELQVLTGLPEIKVTVDWKKLPKSHDRNFYLSEYKTSIRFKKMHEELNSSENRIESARLNARPDILVGLNYRKENVQPTNHFYHAQVSVVIPILDYGQQSVQSARAQFRRNEAQLQLIDQESKTQLEQFFESHQSSLKNIEIFPLTLIGQSEKRFRQAEEAFRKGQIDVMTFLQSDTQVHENIDLIYTTRLEYLNSLSGLELQVSHQMEQE